MSTDTPLANLEMLALEHSAEMPEVQEHVIATELEDANEAIETHAHLRDSKGGAFNPDIHVTNASGEPVLTKTGKLRMKAGRKSTVGESAPAPAVNEARNRQAAAHAATLMTEQLGVALGGNQARFIRREDINEETSVFCAYDGYFEARGISDFPPNVALIIALGGYALRVSLQTPAKDKAKSVWFHLKAKIGNRLKKKDKKDASHINSRDDGKRKNDTSEKSSDAVQESRDSNPTT